jgi:hypothetical protein
MKTLDRIPNPGFATPTHLRSLIDLPGEIIQGGTTMDGARFDRKNPHPGVERFAVAIRDSGWSVTLPIIESERLDALSAALDAIPGDGKRGGIRNLLDIPQVRDLAVCPSVRGLAEAVLGRDCVAVRGLFFDKTPGANWKVTWHQDLTIAVNERIALPGYGPWSEKAGVVHVQPPDVILERMLAIRVHLDPCGDENGPVRVLPGTHRSGKLDPDQINAYRERIKPVDCVVERGGILAFHPLLLHSSSPASRPERRRVVHLEFAPFRLNAGLSWRWTV